jgi:hypothetical protein
MAKWNRSMIFVMLGFGLLTDSCKKDHKSEIIIEYQIPFANNMEIDTLHVDSFVERESYDFPTSLEGELAKNNTAKEKIKSAKLTFMRIQVVDYAYADSNKYGNLRDISVLQMDAKKDGIGQQMIAHKNIPDVYTKAVNMDLDDIELKDYLKQESFRLVFRYKKRRPMPNEMPFVVTLKFKVIADPL